MNSFNQSRLRNETIGIHSNILSRITELGTDPKKRKVPDSNLNSKDSKISKRNEPTTLKRSQQTTLQFGKKPKKNELNEGSSSSVEDANLNNGQDSNQGNVHDSQ